MELTGRQIRQLRSMANRLEATIRRRAPDRLGARGKRARQVLGPGHLGHGHPRGCHCTRAPHARRGRPGNRPQVRALPHVSARGHRAHPAGVEPGSALWVRPQRRNATKRDDLSSHMRQLLRRICDGLLVATSCTQQQPRRSRQCACRGWRHSRCWARPADRNGQGCLPAGRCGPGADGTPRGTQG